MQAFNLMLHATVFLAIVGWGDYSILTLAKVGICFTVNALTTALSLSRIARRNALPENGLILSIILLYWTGYLTKFGLGMWIAGQYWVVPRLISESRLLETMPDAFIVFTFGYSGLLAGAFAFTRTTSLNLSLTSIRPRFGFTAIAIVVGLMIKFGLKQVFLLDVPGEVPASMGIPMLAGALALIIGTGFVFFTNILLFCALAARNSAYTFVGLALAFGNALVDLRFGSKDTILYQVAITAIYLYSIRKYLMIDPAGYSKVARKVVGLLGIFGAIIVAAYPYLNSYRNAIRAGSSIGVAVSEALNSDFAASKNPFVEIYNRITGLETLSGILPLKDRLVESDVIENILSAKIIDNLVYEILGSSTVMTRFSITFFGQLYFGLGYIGMVIGCFLLSAIFMLLMRCALSLPAHNAIKLAFVPLLWILLVQALLGSGNLVIAAKELLSVFIMFLLFSRMALPVANPARQRNHLGRALQMRRGPSVPSGLRHMP